MSKVEIWHNPRCSKSREALEYLERRGHDVNIVHYLDAPPSPARIEEVLALLGGMEPRALMRKKEAPYGELGLGDEHRTRDELVRALSENPVLIERPIVIARGRAIVARPERGRSPTTTAEMLAAFLAPGRPHPE